MGSFVFREVQISSSGNQVMPLLESKALKRKSKTIIFKINALC